KKSNFYASPVRVFDMIPSLNLIGAGHVGRALGRLFQARAVFEVQDVLTRAPASAHAAVVFIGAGRAVDAIAAMRPASVWMLAVADDQIASVAAALAQSGLADGATVFHCSGAKASNELAPLAARGAQVAACTRCAALPIPKPSRPISMAP